MLALLPPFDHALGIGDLEDLFVSGWVGAMVLVLALLEVYQWEVDLAERALLLEVFE